MPKPVSDIEVAVVQITTVVASTVLLLSGDTSLWALGLWVVGLVTMVYVGVCASEVTR